MRVRIKTKEQLLNTPGVLMNEHGEFSGPNDYFTIGMMDYLGKMVDLYPRGNVADTEIGTIRTPQRWFHTHEWMVVDPKSENFNELYNKLNGN